MKFTMDYSTKEIKFLRITVTKVGNKLKTDLYCKSTYTHQYLHEQSCHCNVCKGSISYGQVVRFERICSAEEKVNNHLEQLKQCLVKRGYREDHVYSEIEIIKLVERAASFQLRDKKLMIV